MKVSEKVEESEIGSLRDYFAAAALTGLCHNSHQAMNENVARQAWRIADIMLKQRELTNSDK